MKNKQLAPKQKSKPVAAVVSRAPRATFSDEFKRTAVARLREIDTNATLLALELGIRRNQLYKWANTLDALEAGKSLRAPGRPPASEDTEVVRLRRELASAQQELAVLKKFDAYLTRLKK
ncbi:MAG: transposase [Pseudomonadota bacterium]